MDTEAEIANSLYVLLKYRNKDRSYLTQSILAEDIGRLLLTAEARGRASFSKTLFKLIDKYLQEMRAEVEAQITGNKETIYTIGAGNEI